MEHDNEAMGQVVDGDTLVYVRVVPHSPARVWRAISDEAELSAWMRYPIKFTAEVGAPVDFFSGEIVGQVFVVDPPHTLAFSFWDAAKPEMVARVPLDWTVRWDLESIEGGGCQITFTHRWLTGHAMWGVGAGWHEFLDGLMAFLAGEAVGEMASDAWAELSIGYRPYLSNELRSWAAIAATEAREALERGDAEAGVERIRRLELAANLLADIAAQTGAQPEVA